MSLFWHVWSLWEKGGEALPRGFMEITSDLALRPLDNKIETKVRLPFCALQSAVSEIVLMSNIMIMTNQ